MRKPNTHEIYLDSLRGIAVSIIILFHFNFAFFSGGYIGVDIFFVISGFLITRKIISGIESQNFSFSEFYANRIRRIFPALFILMIFILMLGITFFDYEKFKRIGEGIAAIVLFGSNVLFWYQSGYFDNSSMGNSLLHTWSLAVEEQIYFILPLIIILSKKYLVNKFNLVLGIIAILSFILFCIGTFHFPNATFYFMPTRMWEFLTGSLLSTIVLGKEYKNKFLNLLALTGFILLVIIIYLNYVNWLTVSGSIFLSVISTAFIIISGFDNNKTITKQLLNHSPLIFIGKISYSLYLWHWPVYCLFDYLVIGELSNVQLIVCIGLTFIFSYLSWYLIEVPFRKTYKWIKNKTATYIFFLVASFLLFIAGFFIYINNGFPKRFDENENLLMINEHVNKLAKLQEASIHRLESGMMPVKLGSPAEPVSFLIWGDSHALGFSTSLDIAARKNNKAGYILSRSGTMPVLSIVDRNDIANVKLNFNNAVIHFIETHREIKTIFLACRWSYHFKGSYLNEVKSKMEYLDLVDGSGEKADSELLKIGLKRTVQKLLSLGLKVVIINQVPENQYDATSYLIMKRINNIFSLSHNISPSTIDYLKRNLEVNDAFDELASYTGVSILRIDKILESEGSYLTTINNYPLYTDNNHLSLFGLNYVEPMFDKYFRSQH